MVIMNGKPTPNQPNIQRVTPEELRLRFNEGNYWTKAQAGDLKEVVLESCISTALADKESVQITSEMVSYRDKTTDEEVARIHQYKRPDGTLAASGKPDPKRLLEDGILYRLEKKKK